MKSIVFCAARPLAQPPWTLLPTGQRTFPPGLAVHRSVVERLVGADRLRAAKLAPYNPESLAVSYLSTGRIKDGVRVIG